MFALVGCHVGGSSHRTSSFLQTAPVVALASASREAAEASDASHKCPAMNEIKNQEASPIRNPFSRSPNLHSVVKIYCLGCITKIPERNQQVL